MPADPDPSSYLAMFERSRARIAAANAESRQAIPRHSVETMTTNKLTTIAEIREALEAVVSQRVMRSLKATYRAEMADELLSRIPAAPESGWRPIETAPRDGSCFLLWLDANPQHPEGQCVEAAWWADLRSEDIEPDAAFITHSGQVYDDTDEGRAPIRGWQPLPTPPQPKEFTDAD